MTLYTYIGIEHIKDLSSLSYGDAAEVIAKDGIHILINLDGYTSRGAKTEILALRPAAVQVCLCVLYILLEYVWCIYVVYVCDIVCAHMYVRMLMCVVFAVSMCICVCMAYTNTVACMYRQYMCVYVYAICCTSISIVYVVKYLAHIFILILLL